MKHYLVVAFVLLFVQTMTACAQDQAVVPKKPTVEEYIGLWSTFEEGTPPRKQNGEEESRLVILRDAANRIVVFLAYRRADRQMGFLYGTAKYDKGELYLVDQKGFPYVIRFGKDLNHGSFIGISHYGHETEMGSFIRIELK